MTDEHEPDPRIDPAEDARIRALLADLGSARDPEGSAVPPEVAARLEETLAGLVADREPASEAPATSGSTVVPLRRRWASKATAAAAAVIVIGVGGVAVANLGGADGESATSADSAAGGSAESKAEPQDSGTPGAPTAEQPGTSSLISPDVPALAAGTFDTQVARLVDQGQVAVPGPDAARQRNDLSEEQADKDDAVTNTAKGGCPGPETRDGSRHTTVLYDGSPAALVVHPEREGYRLVEAWTCTGAERLDSARIPAMVDTSGQGSGQGSGQSSPGDPGSGNPTPSP